MKKIIDINYENFDIKGGCDTCDYGSQYIRDMEIVYEDNTKLLFHIDSSIDMLMSEADWMLTLVNAKSENDIIESFKEKNSYILDPKNDWIKGNVWYELNGEKVYLKGSE